VNTGSFEFEGITYRLNRIVVTSNALGYTMALSDTIDNPFKFPWPGMTLGLNGITTPAAGTYTGTQAFGQITMPNTNFYISSFPGGSASINLTTWTANKAVGTFTVTGSKSSGDTLKTATGSFDFNF
jgi:hypothetical protein